MRLDVFTGRTRGPAHHLLPMALLGIRHCGVEIVIGGITSLRDRRYSVLWMFFLGSGSSSFFTRPESTLITLFIARAVFGYLMYQRVVSHPLFHSR